MDYWTQIKKIGVVATLPMLITACGSESDSTPKQESAFFHAGTGIIANANITIESYENNQWQSIQTLTSSSNGEFDIAAVSFNNDTWYRLTTESGSVLDLDLDGENDETATTFEGRLRSLAKGEWLNTVGGTHIGFYTETAYTHVLTELNNNAINWETIESQLEDVATTLLIKDANNDEAVNYLDILAASPSDLSYTNIVNQLNARDMAKVTTSGKSSTLIWLPHSGAPSLSDISGSLYSHVINSDKTKLYATNLRNGLYVKDLVTGESNLYPSGHINNYELAIDETNQLAYLPNGGGNGTHVIDLQTGEQLDSIITDMRAFAIAAKSDGSKLYISNNSGLHIYDVATTNTITIDMESAQTLKLSDDESYIDISGSSFIARYNLNESSFEFNLELNDTAYGFELNEDQTLAYVANSSEGFSIVNLETESIESYSSPDEEDVYSVVLNPNNTNQVRVISEGTFQTFDLTTKQYTEDEFTSKYPNVYLDAAGITTYLAEDDIYITGENLLAIGAYTAPNLVSQTVENLSAVYSVKVNNLKNQVAFTRYDGNLGIINKLNDTVQYVELRGRPNQITLSPDGQSYYVAIAEVGIDIIDADTLEVENITHTAFYAESDIQFSTNTLYTLDYDSGDINVFDLEDNSYVKTIASPCNTQAMIFDSAQEYLYIGCNNTSGIRRYSLAEETWESFDAYSSQSLTFSPDGKTLYAGQNFQVQALDIESGLVTDTYEGNHVLWQVYYWEEMNALITGGNSGPSYIDLDTGQVYELDNKFGNHFDLDKTTNTLYFGAGSEHGLQQMDLSDFKAE